AARGEGWVKCGEGMGGLGEPGSRRGAGSRADRAHRRERQPEHYWSGSASAEKEQAQRLGQEQPSSWDRYDAAPLLRRAFRPHLLPKSRRPLELKLAVSANLH